MRRTVWSPASLLSREQDCGELSRNSARPLMFTGEEEEGRWIARGYGGKCRGAGIIQRPTALEGFSVFAAERDRDARPWRRVPLPDPGVLST